MEGCRCVEIDVWNGSDGKTIDVVHAFSSVIGKPVHATSKLEIDEVVSMNLYASNLNYDEDMMTHSVKVAND